MRAAFSLHWIAPGATEQVDKRPSEDSWGDGARSSRDKQCSVMGNLQCDLHAPCNGNAARVL